MSGALFHKYLCVFFVIIFYSCKKDTQVLPPANEPDPAAGKTAVKFNFNPFFNNEALVFNRTKLYTNLFGDSLNVGTFKYYISNIKLTDSNGSVFSETESYHLVKHNEINFTSFVIANIPSKSIHTVVETGVPHTYRASLKES